ncbi:type II toxin-antitoxin system RelE/ParE family toxin [Sphingomonas sp. NFR15]|uniref:type II toxin-antitoxin system RelE/ParE family toxin n=1 Tax=Sphingomonas sp. NFR15 TaxID=1566282 RepID=UPI0008842FF9|nr:type II toxin-antitoxin system RelE/ParE family toxin [Sphingomonas sp. NFR15]SDA35052.1 ParE toxin of type II toxin-antitoxin system, parDE [Sphingomonas sp. NFR15]
MIALTLADAAKADLVAILAYGTEAFGIERAESYLRRFDMTFARIREYLLAGRRHDPIRPPIHSVPCGSHRVYYDVLPDRVVVQRVLHKAMDIERWLDT